VSSRNASISCGDRIDALDIAKKKSPPGYAPDGDHAHRITPSEGSLARGGGATTGRRRVGERTL
jgi:hypothetical protein